MKKSIIIYADCIAILEELTFEQAGRLFKAILSYANEEPVTEIEGDPVLGVAYKVLKTQIDRDAEKYAEKCEKNRVIAQKRWERIRENTNAYERIRTHTNVTYNDNENDSDSENDSEVTNVTNKKELSNESKKIAAKAATLARNVETRKKSFYNSLIPYVQMYGKEMVRDFYDYWSELNKSKTKMRFESQPTWEIGKRLATWAKKENNYGKNRQSNSSEKRAVDAASIVARLAAEDDARK